MLNYTPDTNNKWFQKLTVPINTVIKGPTSKQYLLTVINTFYNTLSSIIGEQPNGGQQRQCCPSAVLGVSLSTSSFPSYPNHFSHLYSPSSGPTSHANRPSIQLCFKWDISRHSWTTYTHIQHWSFTKAFEQQARDPSTHHTHSYSSLNGKWTNVTRVTVTTKSSC